MARDEEIEGLKRRIAELEEELAAAHATLAGKNAQLQRILDTTGWRLLQRYGRFKYGVLKPLLGQPLLYRYGRLKHNVVFPLLERAGVRQPGPEQSDGEITYDRWAEMCEAVRYDADRAGRRLARLGQTGRRPLVSVVTPVYNAAEDVLDATIRSVRAQLYPDWELCLARRRLAAPARAPRPRAVRGRGRADSRRPSARRTPASSARLERRARARDGRATSPSSTTTTR